MPGRSSGLRMTADDWLIYLQIYLLVCNYFDSVDI